MFPVISWIALGGRCRACGTRISVQYPLVEATTAILFALVGPRAPSIPLMFAFLVVVSLLILIAAYDIRHTIIPDEWVYAFAALALIIASPSALDLGLQGFFFLFASGPLCALPLFTLWFVSRGTWMGLGDAKLALGIGWLLGIGAGLFALLTSFVLGALISVCILMPWPYIAANIGITRLRTHHKHLTMKSEVPFGPFLVLGTFLVWLMLLWGIALPI